MSFQRSPLRAGIAACALVLPALVPAAAAAGTAPVVFAPLQHAAGTTPFFISHGGGVRNTTTTSTNWSGYAATGGNGAFTSVTTTFTQPAVTCTSGDQYSSFWVGLDGYNSNRVEQTGTEADCVGRTAEYSAWYEMYPRYPVTYGNTVQPGDVITESVTFSGASTYTMTITDSTEGWTKTTTHTPPRRRAFVRRGHCRGARTAAACSRWRTSATSASRGSTVNGATLSTPTPSPSTWSPAPAPHRSHHQLPVRRQLLHHLEQLLTARPWHPAHAGCHGSKLPQGIAPPTRRDEDSRSGRM